VHVHWQDLVHRLVHPPGLVGVRGSLEPLHIGHSLLATANVLLLVVHTGAICPGEDRVALHGPKNFTHSFKLFFASIDHV